jgi:hypothetical protein
MFIVFEEMLYKPAAVTPQQQMRPPAPEQKRNRLDLGKTSMSDSSKPFRQISLAHIKNI